MASWEFLGSDPIDVFIDLPAGSIAIEAGDTEAIIVSLLPSRPSRDADGLISQVTVQFASGRLDVVGPKNVVGLLRHHSGLDLTIRIPQQSRCTVRTASSDLSCIGRLGSLDAHTASGDITAAIIDGPAQLAVASGDIWLEEAARDLTIESASGDVRILRTGGDMTAITTASGDIQVGAVDGGITVHTASGDVQIDSFRNGIAEVNTVSGDVTIGVAPQTGVYLDLGSLTGDVTSDLDRSDQDGDADATIKCTTISGDIHLSRADAAPAGGRDKIRRDS